MNAHSRLPTIQKSGGRLRPSDHFERAYVANVLRAVRPRGSAEDVARSLWPDDEATRAVVQRAAATPAMTTVSGWAAEIAGTASVDFMASLAPQSAAAALMARGMKVQMNAANTVQIPRRNGLPVNVDAAWVAEGAPAPVLNYSLAAGTLGPQRKLLLLSALTRETAEVGGEPVVRQLLRESVSATLDATMFGTGAATTAKPAGLRNGVVPIAAAAGADEEAMLTDLANLAGALNAAGGSGDYCYIAAMPQATAAQLRLGKDRAVTILPTAALSDGIVMAVDVQSFVSSVGSDIRFEASSEVTINFEDAIPAPIVDAGAVPAGAVRSAWQQDLIVTKCSLWVAYAMRQLNSVSVVTGATW